MDFAQSRLQARFGERPDESLWQKLEAVPDSAAALKIAAACGLRRWVEGIAVQANNHEIEIALRERWRACVTELASWMPDRWQAAMLWTRGLVDLPALCYLARGGAPLPWMSGDAVLKKYALVDATTREALLLESCRAIMVPSAENIECAVMPAQPGPTQVCQAWVAEWRRLWPRWSDTDSLDDLALLFDAAMRQPATIGRDELLRKLRRMLRRTVLRPVAAFVYVAFATIDMERLRAALMTPALMREGVIPS